MEFTEKTIDLVLDLIKGVLRRLRAGCSEAEFREIIDQLSSPDTD